MGFKKRTFTGTVRSAVLRSLETGDAISRRDLLARLRSDTDMTEPVSQRTLRTALTKLIDARRVALQGSRSTARFTAVS